jgi:hypothetical protein
MIARALFTAFLLAANLPATAGDWPWWRGPGHDGAAASDAAPPTAFGEDQGILWSVAIPGRGHGSACVAGDRVYLATADELLTEHAPTPCDLKFLAKRYVFDLR